MIDGSARAGGRSAPEATGHRTITRTADWPAGHQVALFEVDGDAEAAAALLDGVAGFDPVVMSVEHPGPARTRARYLLLPAAQARLWRVAAGGCGPGDLPAIVARLSTPG